MLVLCVLGTMTKKKRKELICLLQKTKKIFKNALHRGILGSRTRLHVDINTRSQLRPAKAKCLAHDSLESISNVGFAEFASNGDAKPRQLITTCFYINFYPVANMLDIRMGQTLILATGAYAHRLGKTMGHARVNCFRP